MKLKLRTLDDAELRDFRERDQARAAVQALKTSWQAGEYSLHQEFSRVGFAGQPVFNLRAQGPKAATLNRELAGLEFVSCRAWYHQGTETIAMERYTGESPAPTVSLIDLENVAVTDVAPRQRIVWRSQLSGTLVLKDEASFSVLDPLGRRYTLVAGHAHGHMIDDMLVAFNEGQPRSEMTLVDPVLQRREDYLSPELIGAQLELDFTHDLTIRMLHRSELELCFELLRWDKGRNTSFRRFAVAVASIALGTIEE